jgi:hypothetical protein
MIRSSTGALARPKSEIANKPAKAAFCAKIRPSASVTTTECGVLATHAYCDPSSYVSHPRPTSPQLRWKIQAIREEYLPLEQALPSAKRPTSRGPPHADIEPRSRHLEQSDSRARHADRWETRRRPREPRELDGTRRDRQQPSLKRCSASCSVGGPKPRRNNQLFHLLAQ